MNEAVLTTQIPGIKFLNRGKVRDIYEHEGRLLIVATDRVSAFDVVMPNGIPGKGKVLTAISLFWFARFQNLVPNHLTGESLKDLGLERHAPVLGGRTMICRKMKVVPVECVVRGYITGSGYKDYMKTGSVCGIALPKGLVNSEKLPEPLFTPSTKAEKGHDENISFGQVEDLVGKEKAAKLRDLSLKIYNEGAEYARSRGIIIADTKFEWGEDEKGNLVLIDEVLTMDSSRFWPLADYAKGREQNSFDKQIVRNHLETLSWNKTPPGPMLPDDVIRKTQEKYLEGYRLLTGRSLNLSEGAVS
ncbi:MAG: phosphoribosylaminoimidazolesuccinocarboxamide synthase [Planctomycetota bacterium]